VADPLMEENTVSLCSLGSGRGLDGRRLSKLDRIPSIKLLAYRLCDRYFEVDGDVAKYEFNGGVGGQEDDCGCWDGAKNESVEAFTVTSSAVYSMTVVENVGD
jgi:hypothetical protein